MGRVGHFQLTLNNPGLGYKESGPSAPVTRHPRSPTVLHTLLGPRPLLPQGHGIPSPALTALRSERGGKSKVCLPLREQDKPGVWLLTYETVYHPPRPGPRGLGSDPASPVAENTVTIRDQEVRLPNRFSPKLEIQLEIPPFKTKVLSYQWDFNSARS